MDQRMLFGSLERQEHPELIKKYLGSVVPTADNYFAALNRPVCCFALCVSVPTVRTVFDHVSHEESHVSHVPSCSQCGLQRWILLLHPQGHHVPDGDLHLLPHQQQGPKFAEEQEEYL